MKTVLYLHGLHSMPGGNKPRYLEKIGYRVLNPLLPKNSWEDSIEIAQSFVDLKNPDVIVGSSRGGAVAMSINTSGAPLVLVSPAWNRFKVPKNIPSSSVIIAPPDDKIVPTTDSKDLVASCGGTFICAGLDHRMSSQDALEAIADAVRWVLR